MKLLKQMSKRDLLALQLGGIVLLGFAVYAFFWEPLKIDNQKLRNSIINQQNNLSELNALIEEYHQMSSSPTAMRKALPGSLFSVVDQTSNKEGVKNSIKNMTPLGDKKVNVKFQKVDFNRFMQWLSQISITYGISVERINIQQHNEEGKVDAQLVIEV